ncbi:pyridoxal phosphate-dependent aminotransferase family protein [Patescibacteria group bacterium]|nr:pyridoxal phosphate-dependent aminotransferase family protein [Patescibacteria group bacterium]
MQNIIDSLNEIRKLGQYPDVHVIESSPEPEILINGKKILLFCSSNYLGMATNQQLIDSVALSFKKYGTGSGGSRLLSGTYDAHILLDKKVAAFKSAEDALTFNSGFQTNFSVINSIANPFKLSLKSMFLSQKTIIFSDALNHASIVDGCRSSKSEVFIYKHNDMQDLERGLKKYKKKRKLIVTDGVFSMDGDIAKLDQIVKLSEIYGGLIYVDDAHATGVLGNFGGGTAEHYNVQDKIDIQMGTFSKAVGVLGGYIAGRKELIEYLRVATRSYIFSTAMPPAIAEIIAKSLDIIHNNNDLRVRIKENGDYLRDNLQNLGFNTLTSETQIIPILIGDDNKAIEAARYLFDRNIFGPSVRWPVVEKNRSRIRLTVMSTHTKEHLDYLLSVCSKMKKDLKIN